MKKRGLIAVEYLLFFIVIISLASSFVALYYNKVSQVKNKILSVWRDLTLEPINIEIYVEKNKISLWKNRITITIENPTTNNYISCNVLLELNISQYIEENLIRKDLRDIIFTDSNFNQVPYVILNGYTVNKTELFQLPTSSICDINPKIKYVRVNSSEINFGESLPTDVNDLYWYEENFDDSSWLEGSIPIGNGKYSDEICTSIDHHPPEDLFVRFWFNVSNYEEIYGILVKISSSGGATCYLNEKKILDDVKNNHDRRYWNYIIFVKKDYISPINNLLACWIHNDNSSLFFNIYIIEVEQSIDYNKVLFIVNIGNITAGQNKTIYMLINNKQAGKLLYYSSPGDFFDHFDYLNENWQSNNSFYINPGKSSMVLDIYNNSVEVHENVTVIKRNSPFCVINELEIEKLYYPNETNISIGLINNSNGYYVEYSFSRNEFIVKKDNIGIFFNTYNLTPGVPYYFFTCIDNLKVNFTVYEGNFENLVFNRILYDTLYDNLVFSISGSNTPNSTANLSYNTSDSILLTLDFVLIYNDTCNRVVNKYFGSLENNTDVYNVIIENFDNKVVRYDQLTILIDSTIIDKEKIKVLVGDNDYYFEKGEKIIIEGLNLTEGYHIIEFVTPKYYVRKTIFIQ